MDVTTRPLVSGAQPKPQPQPQPQSAPRPKPKPKPKPTTSGGPGRLRAAWSSAHAPVAGVPRWARYAALAVPFTVLPSSLWRVVAEGGDHGSGSLPEWLPTWVYVFLLSAVSELLAFTAVGLIASWGEVFPRWIPVLGGRRVPTPAAVVPAAFGAVILTFLWTSAFVADFMGVTLRGEPTPEGYPGQAGGWEEAVFYASYTPLLLWGPLLGAVTVAYVKRRRSAAALPGPLPA